MTKRRRSTSYVTPRTVNRRFNPQIRPITPASSMGSAISAMLRLGRTTPRSTRRRLSFGGGRRSSVYAQSGTAATVVRKRSRPITKPKRKVLVSRGLRDKIKKVVNGAKIIGMTQEISYGIERFLVAEDNKQTLAEITTMNSTLQDPHFSRNKIMDAASCLWNEKVQNEVKSITDSRNFPTDKLRVRVVNSSVNYHFKNNTQRKMFCQLIECYPVSAQVLYDPFSAWISALGFQNTNQGPNQNNIAVGELYTNPAMLPDFRKQWKTRTTRFEIHPGGEYDHFIQGPKDEMFNFQSFWNGTTFQNYHKKACFTLLTYHPDLVTTGSNDAVGTFGRFTGALNITNKQGLVFEAVQRFTLEMPEQTGFVTPIAAAGPGTPNDNRQFSYAYKTYGNAQGDLPIVEVNEQNPVQYVADP